MESRTRIATIAFLDKHQSENSSIESTTNFYANADNFSGELLLAEGDKKVYIRLHKKREFEIQVSGFSTCEVLPLVFDYFGPHNFPQHELQFDGREMLEFTRWLNCNHFTFWALSSANGFNAKSALTLAMEEHETKDEAWTAHVEGGTGLMTSTMREVRFRLLCTCEGIVRLNELCTGRTS